MFTRSRRVPVKNRERAVAFYSALLGVGFERSSPTLTFDESAADVALLHFHVADRLDDVLACVWSNGGHIVQPEPIDRRALVIDCEGNHLALHTG